MGARGPLPRVGVVRNGTSDASNVTVLPPLDAPSAPDGLSDAGRAVWDACWSLEWITSTDLGAVVDLARLTDQHAALAESVRTVGVTAREPIQNSSGQVIGERTTTHPALAELRKLEASIDRLRNSLGLTPSSRARLGLKIEPRRRPAASSAQVERALAALVGGAE